MHFIEHFVIEMINIQVKGSKEPVLLTLWRVLGLKKEKLITSLNMFNKYYSQCE
jgi:hypothetical protein